MTNLTGKALKDRAAELNIKGRSSMSADELRQAIIEADNANVDFLAPGMALKVAREADSVAPVAKPQATQAKPHIGRETIEVNATADNTNLLRQATSNALGSASPLTMSARVGNYTNDGRKNLTPAQRKRAGKKFLKHGK